MMTSCSEYFINKHLPVHNHEVKLSVSCFIVSCIVFVHMQPGAMGDDEVKSTVCYAICVSMAVFCVCVWCICVYDALCELVIDHQRFDEFINVIEAYLCF